MHMFKWLYLSCYYCYYYAVPPPPPPHLIDNYPGQLVGIQSNQVSEGNPFQTAPINPSKPDGILIILICIFG